MLYERAKLMIFMDTSLLSPLSSGNPYTTPDIKFGLHHHVRSVPCLRLSPSLKRDSCFCVSVLSIAVARCQRSCFFKQQCPPCPPGSSDILLAMLSFTNTITQYSSSHCSRQPQRPPSHQSASTPHLLQSVIISFIYSFVYFMPP